MKSALTTLAALAVLVAAGCESQQDRTAYNTDTRDQQRMNLPGARRLHGLVEELLDEGSDRLSVDILVGKRVIGFGEIVIIEDAMGIRVTDFRSDE